MSWKEAKEVADRIYTELRAKHSPGFIRMVVRAMQRLLARDKGGGEKKDEKVKKSG